MTEFFCTYGDNRDEAIVALLYDDAEGSPAERGRFETHAASCARCRADIAALRSVRAQLVHWSPPEPSFAIHNSQSTRSNPQAAIRDPQWWRAVPVWAQAAAALLFLGVSAGIANLDVRYDQSGLTVKTGWLKGPGGPGGTSGSVATPVAVPAGVTRDELAALERQLKREIRAAQASAPVVAQTVRAAPVADADTTGRVRALVAESEKRQQRELALRIAELLRDVNVQRQADMVKIDRTLGVVQNSVGIEVMKNRQQMNQMDLIYRASQRQ